MDQESPLRCHEGWWIPAYDRRCLKYPRDPGRLYDKGLRFVTDWGVAIDGGSHTGVWTKPLAEKFARVIAFEINPLNAECTAKNAPKAEVRQEALGAWNRTVCWRHGDGEADASVCEITKDAAETVGKTVTEVPLDALSLDNVGLIKLDLQGYDHYALLGASCTIAQSRPVVIFENERVERYGIARTQPRTLMSTLGYTLIESFAQEELWVAKEWFE